MNIFRLCGDLCHIFSIIVLIRRLKSSGNAQGISLRSEQLFLLVSITRYTDLFTTFYSWYNTTAKLFFIATGFYVIYLMRWHGAISSTYDRELDNFPHWKFLVLPCAVLATIYISISGEGLGLDLIQNVEELPWIFIIQGIMENVQEYLWAFSILLEAVAIMPQLSLLRKYRVVENLTGQYVFLRGIYRLFYIINWVYRSYYERNYWHHYGVYLCGAIQVVLYVEFTYYWVLSRKEGKELAYGKEGDAEYFDCNANELRNTENSSALLGNSEIRKRVKPGTSSSEDDGLP